MSKQQHEWSVKDAETFGGQLASEILVNHEVGDIKEKIGSITADLRFQCAIYLAVAHKLAQDTELIIQLAEAWPNLSFNIANHLQAGGDIESATVIADRLFEIVDFEEAPLSVLEKATTVAIACNMMQRAQACLDICIRRFGSNLDHLVGGRFIAIFHQFVRCGQTDIVRAAWDILLKNNSGNEELRAMCRKFLLKVTLGNTNSPGQDAATDPQLLQQAQARIDSQDRASILALCEESLSDSTDPKVCSSWMQIAEQVLLRHQDLLLSNKIWSIILRLQPRYASAFLRFAEKNAIQGQHPEVDILIDRANLIITQAYQPLKQRDFAPPKKPAIHKDALACEVVIREETHTAHQWLASASQFVESGQYGFAIQVWRPLLQAQPKAAAAITREIIQIANRLPLAQFMMEIPCEEILGDCDAAYEMIRKVAMQIRSKKPDYALYILRLLNSRRMEPEIRAIISDTAIRMQQWEEAVTVWLPLEVNFAEDCAQCAANLIAAGKRDHAHSLFVEVSRVWPAATIRYGYKYFLQPEMGPTVLECVEPLLPTGLETQLTKEQRIALRLFVRQCRDSTRVQELLQQLVQSGALSAEQVAKMSTYGTLRRDAEIEEYLQQYMPTLKSGRFFAEAEDRGVNLQRPGRATTRTARNVVTRTDRLADGAVHPIRKKKDK